MAQDEAAETTAVAIFIKDALSRGAAPREVGVFTRSPESLVRARSFIGCDEDALPLRSRLDLASDEAELEAVYETERQLLYVAATRARDCSSLA